MLGLSLGAVPAIFACAQVRWESHQGFALGCRPAGPSVSLNAIGSFHQHRTLVETDANGRLWSRAAAIRDAGAVAKALLASGLPFMLAREFPDSLRQRARSTKLAFDQFPALEGLC